MNQRNLITLPGPGGSTISCCIIPCGCILMLLAGVLLGGVGLALRLHHRPSMARAAPVALERQRWRLTEIELRRKRIVSARALQKRGG